MEMKVALIGSTNIHNYPAVSDVMDGILKPWIQEQEQQGEVFRPHYVEIISTGETGVGLMGNSYASKNKYMKFTIKPRYSKYGASAARWRDVEIVERATHLVFIYHTTLSENMIRMIRNARNLNKPLVILEYDDKNFKRVSEDIVD